MDIFFVSFGREIPKIDKNWQFRRYLILSVQQSICNEATLRSLSIVHHVLGSYTPSVSLSSPIPTFITSSWPRYRRYYHLHSEPRRKWPSRILPVQVSKNRYRGSSCDHSSSRLQSCSSDVSLCSSLRVFQVDKASVGIHRYQTPSGLIHGIQWIPADATHVLPSGAVPAGNVSLIIYQADCERNIISARISWSPGSRVIRAHGQSLPIYPI